MEMVLHVVLTSGAARLPSRSDGLPDVAAIIASADVVMTVHELVLMVELLWLGLQLGKNLRLVLSLLLQNRLLLEHHLLGMRDSPASEDFWESKRHCST